MALFALCFVVTLLAVAALALGRLWGAPPLRSCRCDGEELSLSCVECPLREAQGPLREAQGPLREAHTAVRRADER